jgi:hypothetical protein
VQTNLRVTHRNPSDDIETGVAIDRYTNEAKRIYGVIDKRVGDFPTWRSNTQ